MPVTLMVAIGLLFASEDMGTGLSRPWTLFLYWAWKCTKQGADSNYVPTISKGVIQIVSEERVSVKGF
jgi:hypothetical protein